jgi:hypothetical protein
MLCVLRESSDKDENPDVVGGWLFSCGWTDFRAAFYSYAPFYDFSFKELAHVAVYL